MYQLAFASDPNESEDLENYYADGVSNLLLDIIIFILIILSKDSKLLLILNNSIYVKTKTIPFLIKQFNTEYPGMLAENEKAIYDVYEQLEQLVFDKYLKNKILVLDMHIRNGMLLSAFDPKTSSPPTSKAMICIKPFDINSI
jgi:hypothetical protein